MNRNNKHKAVFKKQRNLVMIILASAGLIVLAMGFWMADDENAGLLKSLGIGMIVGALVARLIKPGFGYKPTREELEARNFDQDNLEMKN